MPITQLKRRLRSDFIAAMAEFEPEALVRYSEKSYQKRITQTTGDILRSGSRIVMLTGPSATGKTTSAHKLADSIAGLGVKTAVLSLDDFFVGEGHYPKGADGKDDYECLEALDIPHIHSCLQDLYATGECNAPVFDFMTQMPSDKTQHIDCRDGVVIVEGLHAFNPKLTNFLPEKAVLFLYAGLREEYKGVDEDRILATRDIRLARRIVRDWKFRGHDADFTFDIWPNVCSAEEKYIKCFKNRANLLLDTSFSDEVCLWSGMLQQLTAEKYAHDLKRLCAKYASFPQLDPALVPQDSMLREFLGSK